MKPDSGVCKDKSVDRLESLCREIESLRKELIMATDRVRFLEERIEICHKTVFSEQPKAPAYR